MHAKDTTRATLAGYQGKSISINTGLFINNEFVPSLTGNTIDLINPTKNEYLATLSAAQKPDVDRAVEAAEAALPQWKAVPALRRTQLMLTLADLIERDADDLASLQAVDAGILFWELQQLHTPLVLETLRYFAGWADKDAGQLLHVVNGIAYTQSEPLGVCAAIVPWNGPLMMTAWKLAPAIITGNVLIIKPPELAPLYGQKLGELVQEAGFPPGVINILCGEGPVAGQALAEHPRVRKVSFTGSATTGRRIMRASADSNLKKVTLELGGKGPTIVFSDADMANALFWSSLGITANNGQICVAGSRIYVHSSIYEKFLQDFTARAEKFVHGDPLLNETTKGPMISATQRQNVVSYINRGKESSQARLLHGGQDLGGNYVANTTFADVGENETIMKEEIFGPVACIAKFDTESEVIQKANDSEYGLSAAIFTNDVSRAHRVAAALECGTVTVNSWGSISANAPVGGIKQSGFGRDLGREALDAWTTTKTVKINLLPEA